MTNETKGVLIKVRDYLKKSLSQSHAVYENGHEPTREILAKLDEFIEGVDTHKRLDEAISEQEAACKISENICRNEGKPVKVNGITQLYAVLVVEAAKQLSNAVKE